MELHSIAVRALVAYLFLLAMVRITGKRTILQGTPMDFVVALIVGDMIDDLLWAEVPASQFFVGVGMLFMAHVATSQIVYKSPAVARWVEGVPVTLLANGAWCKRGMPAERLDKASILAELRGYEIQDMREVKSATVEVSGTVSVLFESWAREAQECDLEQLQKAKL